MGYFDHPFVSNSRLTVLKKELAGEDYNENPDAYRVGSLVDGVITEPELVDRYGMRINGTGYTFVKSELEMADRMNKSFHAHSLCVQIYKTSIRQVEAYVENVELEYNGIRFRLNMKCKYDFLNDIILADLKSTAATSQAQFEEACDRFDYWRQVALYGKLKDIRRAILIGISKINYTVFIVQLQYEDRRWQKGLSQLNHLAFKYWTLK